MSEKLKKARSTLSKLCKNPDSFRMCIPVNKDDTDIVFSDAFNELEELDERIKKVIEYCNPHPTKMWARLIIGTLKDMDFRDTTQWMKDNGGKNEL